MRERMGLILKLACYVLAALLFYQLVQTALRFNPLRRVAIPALPTLDSETNALAGAAGAGPGKNSTNSPAAGALSTASARTNSVNTNSPVTNAVAVKKSKETGTNIIVAAAGKPDATNFTVPPPYIEGEGKIVAAGSVTNVSTNSLTKTEMAEENSISAAGATNIVTNVARASVKSMTNLPPEIAAMGTNIPMSVAVVGTNAAKTNTAKKSKSTNSPSTGPAMAAMNMNAAMMGGGGKSGKSDLPPEIKARVDRIYESELFGQVMRPQPMALQGIAGNSAFLRTPSGQTGLVKEGDSLGEIKLLRIGINRVLVEQDGQKSELTIFNGYGSESLMPKDKEKETSK